MIRHVVLFTAKEGVEMGIIHEALCRLRAIPHSRRLEVAYNAKKDGLSGEIDIVVYGEFDDFEQLERYKAHPIYQDSVATVRPLRETRIAVDFEASPD